jgi:glycosyltransferase involved in cell wall biosynthesis
MASIRQLHTTDQLVLRVLVVDNASDPPITEAVFEPLSGTAIFTKLIQEPSAGIARARAAAAKASTADWILFVDDDNELNVDYVVKGIEVIRCHPSVGCFGGKLLLPDSITPPDWAKPFLPFLGIKDFGDERIERLSDHWGPWEPPTAGAFVHRDVLQEYLRRAAVQSDKFFQLGRKTGKLFSCEDSILMLGAAKVGRTNAYEPSLVLKHHLATHRFRYTYLVRLMYYYGMSHVILDVLIKGKQPIAEVYKTRLKFARFLFWVFRTERKKSLHYAVAMMAYHLGARNEHLSTTGK